jgi:hypothetical protein
VQVRDLAVSAVRRRAGGVLVEADDEGVLDAEDDVGVEVVSAFLEQVGDQLAVARLLDEEVDVGRTERADVGLADQVADGAVEGD